MDSTTIIITAAILLIDLLVTMAITIEIIERAKLIPINAADIGGIILLVLFNIFCLYAVWEIALPV